MPFFQGKFSSKNFPIFVYFCINLPVFVGFLFGSTLPPLRLPTVAAEPDIPDDLRVNVDLDAAAERRREANLAQIKAAVREEAERKEVGGTREPFVDLLGERAKQEVFFFQV